ncbi:MAG: nucleotide exchange factor GrpE [Kiritimatiellaeota bacterium]|nr:nucleotide exchange factor GrpE [Kiritimatiellota bacterium]
MAHHKHKQQEPQNEAKVSEQPVAEPAPRQEAAPAQPPEANPLEAELAAAKDKYVRLMADFDNFRKRQLREHGEMVRRANENVMEDLLPFLDTFDLALANGGADDPFVKGMRMASGQLANILAKNGMAPVPAEGAFDANAHEALTRLPSAEVPEGEIVTQVRRGWTLNGRLLRAAQVVVSAGAPEEGGQDGAEA